MKKIMAAVLALTMALAFCTTTWADGDVAQIGEQGYSTLQAAVDVATGSDPVTITLLKNAEGKGVVVKAGQNIVLDFGGYTYTLTEGVGSTGTATNGFQLLAGSTVVMKNGTVDIKVGAYVKRMVQNYADVTLTDMTFDVTNLYGMPDYALSFNKGTVLINGATTVVGYQDDLVVFDTCDGDWAGSGVYNNNPIVAVTVDTTGTLPGKVELGGGYLTVNQGELDVVVDSSGTDSGITVGANAEVTLDLNGQNLQGRSQGGNSFDTITNNGTLTITDSSDNKSGAVSAQQGKAPINNADDAKLMLTGVGENAVDISAVAGDNAAVSLNNTYYVGDAAIKNAVNGMSSGDKLTVVNGTVKIGSTEYAENATYTKPYTYYYYTSSTTETTDTSKSSPKTFDAGVAMYGVMAVMSVTGMAYMGKKKF